MSGKGLSRDARPGPGAPDEFLKSNSPLIASQDVPACPVCGSPQFSNFAVGFDYELLTCRNEWQFVQCSECRHVWLNPRPTSSELGTIYPSTYYAYNYSKINPIARRAKEWLDHRKISKIMRLCASPPRTYLDIGCGDGRFLRTIERLGVNRNRLYGLELDDAVVRRLRDEGYTGVLRERVEESASIPDGEIDLATMFHVIEHVDDPGAVIRRISRWLSPQGILALETPNLESWDARLFHDRYWGGYHIPRHWNLFTPATISRLLSQNGLQVLATIYQTGHSFWMYSLHHLIRYHEGSRPRMARLFDPMTSVFGVGFFTAFDLTRKACGARTSAMLVVCQKI